MHFLKRSRTDSVVGEDLLTTKSEQAFLPYQGKIIRNIIINQYHFEKTFSDTAKSINYFGTRVLNHLHRDTRYWAIRDNLFLKENTPLVAYRCADNERYLRSLEYIQDARIVVKPILGSQDSVDVYVITKDLFSMTGQLNNVSTGKFKAQAGDVNLMGGAQNLQGTIMVQKNRDPAFGFGLRYTKYNVLHSFTDFTVAYSTINPNLYDGSNDERAMYVNLQRDLISQYSHLAGGLTIGRNQSMNSYSKPENIYFNYSYNLFDAWIGYNLGVEKFIKDPGRRDKQFISLRYYNNYFTQTPEQVANKLDFRFNSREAVLAQFTFFKQEYYKANFIYGFGTTEDIPYGYNIALTGGWYKQAYLERPYAGIDANFYKVYRKGDIVQYFVRGGSFWDHGEWQDAGILVGASGFSRLLFFQNFKMRQYLRVSYAKQFNRVGLDPLSINNPFGLRYYSSDSVRGTQRISVHSETISFINYKLLGFKFSPFVFADVALLTPEDDFQKSGVYYGLGSGLRARNENLVFKTIELRLAYFPRKAYQSNSFAASLRFNIAFRYNTTYVHEPDIVQLNNDYQNNIF